MPKLSLSIFAIGARQFVVQDAFDIIWFLLLSYILSFTPITIVMSGFFAGALIITFFAPAFRCCIAPSLSVNLPVLSITTSIFKSFQGSCFGSSTDKTFTFFPSIMRESFVYSTVPSYLPCTESYLNKWASVFESVTSFTATQLIFLSLMPALKINLPILPKPLIATFIIVSPLTFIEHTQSMVRKFLIFFTFIAMLIIESHYLTAYP